ncbi:DUF4871 domain-containing protein [Pontibacillus marinus]|uniref:DUF4871 domain-containing protein n=1 Tax=Pontibacillus marinus BH030004 = DSM 16465 TaxID=1385511 RepID=A0A0A5G8I6_9BACI|nr:DUF4871 domain-containing protein [Pontibacillus marinus]KGX89446.1 hypothetical protein N783_06170 [Pontibacillus marinus BH030004 = DSM 16465]
MKTIQNLLIFMTLGMLVACNGGQELTIDTDKTSEKLPVEVRDTTIENIDWELSETFEAGTYTVRGVPNKLGFIDAPFVENKPQKYMWHFWGDVPKGDLTVVGIKKGSQGITPVLMMGKDYVWSYNAPGGPNNGADAHAPSTMKLTEEGSWALLVYLGDEYFGQVIVEVK